METFNQVKLKAPIDELNCFSAGRHWAHILFLFVLSWAALPGFTSAGEIVKIANGEWPPYLSVNLPHHGFASHVVEEAFAAVGLNVRYGFYPWKRSYQYAKDGKDNRGKIWHGTVVWVYTEERAKHFLYSDPVIIDTELLFHLKSRPLEWKVVDDLKGMTIGGTLHTVYPVFEEAEQRGILKIDRGGNYDVLFQKLRWQDIDAVPQVKQVGRYFLNTALSDEERSRITFSPTVVQERKYSLILSRQVPQNRRLLQLFNEGLHLIRSNGRYAELHKELEQGKYDLPVSP